MKTAKKILISILIVIVLFSLIDIVSALAAGWTFQQTTAHEIAQLARDLGLPEDDPIIVRAKELWHEDEGKVAEPEYSEQDIAILARVMYWEAGNGCTEEHMLGVGRVVMNRVSDERFPDTVLFLFIDSSIKV